MKVSSTFEYDRVDDQVLGPFSYMQVVMVRGLMDTWKQPIYIGFDKKMTGLLLNEIILELHKINYNVVACVSDCGGSNQGLWKELNVSAETTFISHPATCDPIFFFADAPHLLKLIRNWFIDNGFVLKNGVILNKNPIKTLVELTDTEITSCYKLSHHHINCERTQRQNVRLAAELLSHTTATALKNIFLTMKMHCNLANLYIL